MDSHTQPTPKEEIPSITNAVADKAEEWAQMDAKGKLALIDELITLNQHYVPMWKEAACHSHHVLASNPDHLEFASSLPLKGAGTFGSHLHSYKALYQSLAATGKPPAPVGLTDHSGQQAVKVWPANTIETIFAGGGVGEVYVEGTCEQFNPLEKEPGLVVVLGAGNFSAPTDILYSLFIENKVVVYKANLVNQIETSYSKRVFQKLIQKGYIAYVYGGVEQGAECLKESRLSHALLTGSDRAHDLIKYGTTDPAQKKSENVKFKPDLKAELGSVNPVIVVPGRTWSAKEMDTWTQALIASKMTNNGHICASPQVLVTCKNWPQREEFLKQMRENFAKSSGTPPYYPKSGETHKRFYEKLKETTKEDPMIKNKEYYDHQQYPVFATNQAPDCWAIREEAFCPIMIEIPLDTKPTYGEFMSAAMEEAHSCWGSLTCMVIIDDQTKSANQEAFRKDLADLRFGSVSINGLPIMNFLTAPLTWGGYPGHTPEDIQSGVGVTGNTFCLKNVQKSVTTFPFGNLALPRIDIPAHKVAKQNDRVLHFLVTKSYRSLTMTLANVLFGI